MKKIMSSWEEEMNAKAFFHCVAAMSRKVDNGAAKALLLAILHFSLRCLSSTPRFKQSSTKGNICLARVGEREGEGRLEHEAS